MSQSIVEQLEEVRSQIEAQFSQAGDFLQSTLSLIGQQIGALNGLATLLDADAVGSASRDLIGTAEALNGIAPRLVQREARLRNLKRIGAGLHLHVLEIRDLLRYLRVFALHIKINGSSLDAETQQFDRFSADMRARIDHGEAQLDDFVAHLGELSRRIDAAAESETALSAQARSMLPSVPDSLATDAAAMGSHQARICEQTSFAADLAKKTQSCILDALSALQVGDCVRQRIEHVQEGLATLEQVKARLAAQGESEEVCARLDRYVCKILSAQLADAARAFDEEASRMVKLMSEMRETTRKLLDVGDINHGESGQGSLRAVEQSVAKALVLIAGMDRAAESADQVQTATMTATEGLVARVTGIKSVKEDVQHMALNATLRCARIGEKGRPLQVVAAELSLYAKKLEAVVMATLRSVEELAQAASTDGERAQTSAKNKLEMAVERLRNAANMVEKDLASAVRQGRSLVTRLGSADGLLNFKTRLVTVVYEVAGALDARAGEPPSDIADIATPAAEILERLSRSYSMEQERIVHAAFALAEAA